MMRWAGAGWLALAGAAAAQAEDPMAEQRCVWACLANSPGAASREYNDCVAQYCVAPDSASGGDAAAVTAPAQSPRPNARPTEAADGPASPADAATGTTEAPAMPAGAAAGEGWTWGETAEGMSAGVADAGRGTRLDWLCGKGRPSFLALSPYQGDGGFVVTAGVRTESYAVQVENGVAYAQVGLASPLFLHIASGPTVAVADGAGQVLGEFSMGGAAMAIGQAEGRCR